ncbi:DUF4192 domain-containing protein [Nocardioides bruguierae]|uniref:DUF4192 domain-containing protein n=1 Tax=Nocardioides bruguierae TaxID=2945102 RepID=A0A9X2ID73_9ACTN|nr:DUF4192 domain-containing protein [Nocardioides bruguierae]MCM0618728.1 DUF4192 domain-containing protein [Nocardioides bruguierae]
MTPAPRTSVPHPGRPARYTARSPEDLVALVPVVLGFEPSESVTMLTFGATRQFHARVDLPPVDDRGGHALAEVVDSLLEPSLRHGVRRVVLVLHARRRRQARRTAEALERAFTAAGIEVVEALRVDGGAWWPAAGPGATGEGTPLPDGPHPFAVRSVVEGRVTHGSREDLAATLARDEEATGAVERALEPAPGSAYGAVARSAAAVTDLLDRRVPGSAAASDAEVAGLLLALEDVDARDAAWMHMRRDTAPDHVGFWTDVVRRAPEPHVADAAAMLGFAAWLAGHGALAWCALDRCLEVEPDHPMAVQVSFLLEHAVPPHDWDRVSRAG